MTSEHDVTTGIPVGTKNDGEKPRWDLLPFDAVETVVRVLSFGAKRYGPWNWVNVKNNPGQDRYLAAMLRHLSAYAQGQWLDSESGLPHLAHVACSALFLISQHLRGKQS